MSEETMGSADVTSTAAYVCASVCVVLFTAGLLFYADVRKHKAARRPIGAKRGSHLKPVPVRKRVSTRDKTKKPLKRRLVYAKQDDQIPSDADFVIIGSGIAGLTCAATLARCGYTVVVFEAHDRLGGCCHTFDNKYNWEIGVHYVGLAHEYERYLSVLGSKNSAVEWHMLGDPTDGHAYDRYVLGQGSKRTEFLNRKDSRYSDLRAKFTDAADRASLDAFVGLGKRAKLVFAFSFVARSLPLAAHKLLFAVAAWFLPKCWNRDADSVLKQLCPDNPLLALHLSGCIGDMGGQLRHNLFSILSGLLDHFDGGAFFPVGGADTVVRTLVNTIDAFGGSCLASAPVKQVDVDGGRATGVTVVCANGREIQVRAKRGVISAAGLINTYRKLVAPEHMPAPFMSTVRRIEAQIELAHSAQHFQVLLGFDRSSQELRLPTFNTWFVLSSDEQKWDYDTFLDDFHKDPLNAPLMCMVAFPSAKDPAYSEEYSSCTILSEVPFARFERWQHQTVMARDDEYTALKAKIAARFIGLLMTEWPQLKGRLVKTEVGSPLSAQHYLNSPIGESYGLSCCKERYCDVDITRVLRPIQPLDGFYLSGQDIMTPSFSGGMQSGLMTAQHILGYGFACMAAQRDVIKDLRRMDDIE